MFSSFFDLGKLPVSWTGTRKNFLSKSSACSVWAVFECWVHGVPVPASPASAVRRIDPFFLRFLACGRSSLLNGIACGWYRLSNWERCCARQWHNHFIFGIFNWFFNCAPAWNLLFPPGKFLAWRHLVGLPCSSAFISLTSGNGLAQGYFAKFERP